MFISGLNSGGIFGGSSSSIASNCFTSSTVSRTTGGYGAFDEAGYALDGMKLRFDSNVYEGFSASVSYES